MISRQTKVAALCATLALSVSGCAHRNGLLLSDSAMQSEAVKEINHELDTALGVVDQRILDESQQPSDKASQFELSSDVLSALEPKSTIPVKPTEPRFDISVNDVPAADFFAGLVAQTAQNIVIHPDVQGSISLNLRDVSLTDVIDVVSDIYGYEFEKDSRIIKVFPSGIRTKVYQINYLDVVRSGGSETRVSSGQITQNVSGNSSSSSSSSSSNSSSSTSTSSLSSGTQINTRSENNFWDSLENALKLIIGDKPEYSVVLTPSAGVAVVRAGAEELRAVENYLRNAELIMQRQVLLEAKILEVDLDKGYQQGIDWSFADSGNISNGVARNSINLEQLGLDVAATAATNPGVFASTIRLGDFRTTIDLLGTQGNVQVLSSPRISTVNNQKAVIKVGSDEYFVTDIDFESNSDSNSTSTDIEITPFFSGIALDVTPQISEDGDIILHVHPTISRVEDQQKTITIAGDNINLPLALSTIRESDSVITAEDGQIVVIGGLIQRRSSDDNASVPFFGDIPLIGELFQQKAQRSEKTELVILLRPTITDNHSIKRDIQQARERFGDYQDLLMAQ